MITTVKCSIPSQLNNMSRVVVTDFRLPIYACSLIIVNSCPRALVMYLYIYTHIYIADMHTKEVSKCTVSS